MSNKFKEWKEVVWGRDEYMAFIGPVFINNKE
jgi:hypothetical protein